MRGNMRGNAVDSSNLTQLLQRDNRWSARLTQGSVGYALKVRIAFLLVTLMGGMAVGGVIEAYEGTLEAVVAAAIFIPVVMDMGGNVGTQSTTIFARGIAWQHISLPDFIHYVWREVKIALLMGIILGLLGGIIAYYWQGLPNDTPGIGLAVGLSLLIVITVASILGTVLPWIMLKLGFDHGPGADPFITTIKDFTGLIIYFALVNLFVGITS
jgi:magnesium transporter